MKVEIKKGIAKGCVDAPPSKSMAHRMLICAGLSSGTCKVHGIADSMDVMATIDCLKAIGAKCSKEGESVTVTGVDITRKSVKNVLKCRESGSTLRFFIPICLASGDEVILEGSKRLLERPLDIYKELCQNRGLEFYHDSQQVKVKGPLESGVFEVAGNVSSQFISGLLFVLPLLDGDSKIKLKPPVESRSYIDMTIASLEAFGVKILWQDDNTIVIKGNQSYSAKEVYVEGDYSNAAFFEALNVLGGDVKIGNLEEKSLQGDKVYGEMFEELKNGTARLDISDCPDLGPILFALAAAKKGGVFTGTKRLKIKESDRGKVMTDELRKFGVSSKLEDDTVIIDSCDLACPDAEFYGHNDHRIVMSMAVLSTITGGTIEGAEAVTKSFPDFFEKLKSLGIEVEIIED